MTPETIQISDLTLAQCYDIVHRDDCSPRVLKALAHHHSAAIRAAIANHTRTPASIKHSYVYDSHQLVRHRLAGNPQTDSDDLDILSRDIAIPVRQGVAHNPNAPPDTLRYLADRSDTIILVQIVRNPGCPVDVLTRLADHPAAQIRQGVLDHPRVGPEAISKLVAYDQTRVAALAHPQCPDYLRTISALGRSS